MRNFYFGLDLGHYEIKFCLLEEDNLGKFTAYNHSLRNEYLKEEEIIEFDALVNDLDNFIFNILQNFNINKIDKIYVAFNSHCFQSYFQKGHTIFEGNIEEKDIERAIKTAKTSLIINNQEILIEEPIKFILDGEQEIRNPIGFSGRRLDIEAIFITCHKSILTKLQNIFNELKINNVFFVPAFYAASKICLSKKEKEIGVGLLDLGAETTTLSIFQYNKLMNYKSFKFGGDHLIQDLAIHFKIDIEEAEKIQLDFLNDQIGKDSKKKIKIKKFIEKKLKEYFEKSGLKNYLKDIKNNYRLPGGVILNGSFAKIFNFDSLIKNIIDMQVKLPKADYLEIFKNTDDILKYSTAVGCALMNKESFDKKNDWFEKIKNFFTFRS